MKILPMTQDKRNIVAAWAVPEIENGDGWRVGYEGVTSIVIYEEVGQGAMVPWIAILVGDQVLYRRPAATVALEYELEPR